MDDTGSARIGHRKLRSEVMFQLVQRAIEDVFADARNGPLCGSPAAVTDIWLSFMLADITVDLKHGMCCCSRHIQAVALSAPPGTEMLEIIIQDGITQTTILGDGTAIRKFNLGYDPRLAHTFAVTWANSSTSSYLDQFITEYLYLPDL